jgi:hypothetical protein
VRRRLLLTLTSTALVCLLAGCSSSKGSAGDTTPPTPATTATTAAPTTTAPAGPTMGFPTNEAAAQHLIDAWRTHDQASALQGATASAVATMLAIPNGTLNVRGCDAGEFTTSSCVYRLLSNQWEIRIDLEKHPAGWIVADVQYSPPTQ